MERFTIEPRLNWQSKVRAQGLLWEMDDSQPYWRDDVYYTLSATEVDAIEEATYQLYQLFLRVGEALVKDRTGWLNRFGIPDWAHGLIRAVWETEPPCLNYGRFDFALGPDGIPKLLEFNCDTPTSLLEASVIQWSWKEEVFPHHDQFNSIEDKLLNKWLELRSYLPLGEVVHFASSQFAGAEDEITTAYMADIAQRAGHKAKLIKLDDLGDTGKASFVDRDDVEIKTLYKLYPWENIVNEPYGPKLGLCSITWLEPIWKMLWSNKAILPLLWTFEPNHPNLLECSYFKPNGNYVKKPILGREGSNVEIVVDGVRVAGTGGQYGSEGYVYQDYVALPDFDNGKSRPVIGSWIVEGQPAGIGIREDGLITGNMARFVPHIIRG